MPNPGHTTPHLPGPKPIHHPRSLLAALLALTTLAALALPACNTSRSSNRTNAERVTQRSRPTTATEAEQAVARANQLRAQGIDAVALEEFERAIAINPNLTTAYLGAGDIYRETGQYNLAEQRYRRATEVEPDNFDAQYYLALSLQLLDRVSEAVRSYLRALSLRPNDFEANLNLAIAYLQLEEPAQARAYAERAARLRPQSGPARVNLGAVYAGLDLHDAAIIEYQQAAELMELTPELLLNLAESLGEVNRYAEMAATLDQLIRIAPSAVAHERLGSARFRLRQYGLALESFTTATELDPTHFPAWNGVGVCKLNAYLWSERTDKLALDDAISALRRSLRIESRQPKIVELLNRYN